MMRQMETLAFMGKVRLYQDMEETIAAIQTELTNLNVSYTMETKGSYVFFTVDADTLYNVLFNQVEATEEVSETVEEVVTTKSNFVTGSLKVQSIEAAPSVDGKGKWFKLIPVNYDKAVKFLHEVLFLSDFMVIGESIYTKNLAYIVE